MVDPHEVRMAAGQGAVALLDVLDDETVTLLEPLIENVHAVTARLRDRGLSTSGILQAMVGICVAAALQEQDQD